MLVVYRLARVLLKMQTCNADCFRAAIRQVDFNLTLANNRVQELRNLVALRQVGLEIILPLENGGLVDLRVQTETGANSLLDTIFIQNGKHPRHRRINQ